MTMQVHWPQIRTAAEAQLTLTQRWAIARARAQRTLARVQKFDPSQPRDEHGRWADTGASDGVPSVPIDNAKVEAKTKHNVAQASAAALAAGVTPLPGSNGQHPNTIASRLVSAKGAKPAYGQPDLASMKLDPVRYEHDVGLFKNESFYPNFRGTDLKGSTDQQARAAVDHFKENLKFLYSFADKSTQVWYDGARALVDDRAKLWGYNDASVAAVYAALSPTKDWDQNVHLGDMLMKVYREQQGHAWDKEMEATAKSIWSKKNQKIVDLVRGRTLGELKTAAEKAVWIRTYDEAHSNRQYRIVLPNGALNGIARNDDKNKTPSKVVWQSLASITNAVKALEANGNPAAISAAMGSAHKVRSFFNNILDPHSANGDVTIDTHAVGAALLRQLSNKTAPVLQNFGLHPGKKEKPEGWEAASSSIKTGLSGTYAVYAQAYREAAKELGIQPRQLQSAVWVVKRNTFGELGAKQQGAVEAAWRKYHDDPKVTLADTQRTIAELVGLKQHERRHYRADAAGGHRGDARELHRRELGRAAAGVDRRTGDGAAEGAAGLDVVRGAQRRAGAEEVNGYLSDVVRFDPSQPRDEHGRWTDAGGTDDAGSGPPGSPQAADAGGAGAAQGRLGTASNPYSVRSPSDAERGRDVKAVCSLNAAGRAAAEQLKVTPLTFHELTPAGGTRFHDAIEAAKQASPHGAAVALYPVGDYQGMRLFLTEDGKSGFALKGDDIVSAFKHPDSTAKGFAPSALALATQQGGRRLDAFDTVLPRLYSDSGFRAVARLAWDDKQAPADWDYQKFSAFNGGRPDVVFMALDRTAGKYQPGDGARVHDYDAGTAVQQDVLRGRPPLITGPGVVKQAQVRAAIDALPASHAEQLKHVPVTFAKSPEEFPEHVNAGYGRSTVGLFSWANDKPAVYVAESTKAMLTPPEGGAAKEVAFPTRGLEAVVTHELGHALDYSNGWKHSAAIDSGLMASLLTRDEIKDGLYWLQDKKETFAELYSALHNPNKSADQRYFGGMTRGRVDEVFGRELARIRAIKQFGTIVSRASIKLPEVQSGWFVNSHGDLYVLLNGMPYAVDVAGTAYEHVKLPPGEYADDAALSAAVNASKAFDPSQPRDEHGRWAGGGGDGASGGSTAGEPMSKSEIATYVNNWTGPRWEDHQHAARAVISGVPRDEYICSDCPGDDAKRYDAAKSMLDLIELSPVDKVLYRGLFAVGDYQVGDKFSESLSSWTGRSDLAAEYASGHYTAKPEQLTILALMQSDNMKGINVSSRLPDSASDELKNADEWLTSGQYEVVDVREEGGVHEVSVRRIGPAVEDNLKKAYDESEHPRDEHGRWTDAGGGDEGAADKPSPSAPEKLLLVSERPSQDKLDRWTKQVRERVDELTASNAGQEPDTPEMTELNRMNHALTRYGLTAQAELDSDRIGLQTVYDGDGKLLGTALTKYDPATSVARVMSAGGLDKDAKVKALEQLIRRYSDKAERIEAKVWADQPDDVAIYEQAGFRVQPLQPGETAGGLVTMIHGQEGPTAREREQAQRQSAEHSKFILGASQAAAQLLDYDPKMVEVSSADSTFTVGGESMPRKAAGLAHTSTGKITMFPAQLPDAISAVSVMAHEVAHQKYDAVLRAISAEFGQAIADSKTQGGGVFAADGTLLPPYDQKYPIYTRFQRHEQNLDKRIKSDGITPYSKAYWEQAKPGTEKQVSLYAAQHETIAEMARRLNDTGKLEGAAVWKSYYKDIDKTWKELSSGQRRPPA